MSHFFHILLVNSSVAMALRKDRNNMGSKIYNGITGILKVICAAFTGLVIGGVAIYDKVIYVPYYQFADLQIVFELLFLVFATLGYIAVIIRGFSQIKSLFKPSKANIVVTTCINALVLIFIIASYSAYSIYGIVFRSDDMLVISLLIYIFSIILIFIDEIFLLIQIKKEKLKFFTEDNCLKILNIILRAIVPALIIILLVIFSLMIKHNLDMIKENEAIDTGFDSFVMTDFEGNEYTEELFKGHKVTMINVWGTFCHNCIDEMPDLDEISKMFDEKDFQLIGLTGDLYGPGELDQGKVDLAINIVENMGLTYPILIPSKGLQSGVVNNIHLYPTTIFFDENGKQLKTVAGDKSKDEWIEEIKEILADEE